MKVLIEHRRETKDIDFSGKAGKLLKLLGINPEVVLITRNGELITEDDSLSPEDNVKLISVVSGG